jgi:23S rRNA (guanosine2251-2'-O)-methyltransferase
MDEKILGRNPVREILRARSRRIKKIVIAEGTKGEPIEDIVRLAEERSLKMEYTLRDNLTRVADSPHHQGVMAIVSPYSYRELEEILTAISRGKEIFLLILDQIEDPQNLGSLLRTAETVGVQGVIIPERRAVGITAAVVKASAGSSEHIPVVRVVNLARTIDNLKERGIWIVGLDATASQEIYQLDLHIPLALVIGNEGRGIQFLIKKKCDFLTRLPMKGKVSSLNAAVAGAVAMYEVLRQRECSEAVRLLSSQ